MMNVDANLNVLNFSPHPSLLFPQLPYYIRLQFPKVGKNVDDGDDCP